MDPKTKQLVEEAEARAAKATEGPWRTCGASEDRCQCGMIWAIPHDGVVLSGVSTDEMTNSFFSREQMCDNVTFAAHARSDIPALCSAVREQDKRARHAEQERDAFDKRIMELEAQLQERTAAAAAWDALAVARLKILTEYEVKITRLEAERDDARDWVRKLTQETRVLTCAFCGEAYPPNTPESNDNALTAHVKICAKHPMREVEKERDELRGRLAKHEANTEETRGLTLA